MHAVNANEIPETGLVKKIAAHIHKRTSCFLCDTHNGVGIRFVKTVDALHISEPAEDLLWVVSIAPEEGEVTLRVNRRERHQHGLDIRPLEVSHHTVIGFFKMGKPCERFVLRFRKNGDFVPLKVAIVPTELDERIITCNALIQILAKQGNSPCLP